MLKILSPQPFPFDYDDWKKQSFQQRLKMLCQAWALQGYGTPVAVYSFYFAKILLYLGVWLLFCSFSIELGGVTDIAYWWFNPEALQKAIIWSILFEGLGLGSGSGPLTARYFPPIGGVLHFLRPGTIMMPLFSGVPIIGRNKRTILEAGLYFGHIFFLIRALIAPELTFGYLLPTLILLPVLGILDRTIFLSARSEHYFIAFICFLFPEDAVSGAKLVWWAIWFWAATSKLNKHFPSVVAVMISNSAIFRFQWFRKRLYRNFPEDLRASKLAVLMAHTGTFIEFLFPLILIFNTGGIGTNVALVVMVLFHLFITLNVPMAVPIEWNVIMVYGAFVLFGHHANIWIFDVDSILLAAMLILSLVLIPVIGNLVPRWVSFLMAMRYYAGNWAYSIWLFKGKANDKLDDNILKSSKTVGRQLAMFYDEKTADILLSKVIAFRSMHLHGRILPSLIPRAVDDIDEYTWRDGELVAGMVLGWNFGDGHLHNEELLAAIQSRCNFATGELRCIFVQAQPFCRPHLDWRIVDAKNGLIEKGRTEVRELMELQPWGEE